jgi:hypothetical protein
MNVFPSPSKPLLPVSTIVESSSCVHLPHLSFVEDSVDEKTDNQQPQTPRSPFASSFQWAFRVLRTSPSPKPSKHHHSRAMADLMDIDNSFYSNSRTRAPFRPAKSNKGTPNWQLKQFAEATLGSGSLRKAVKLPEGEDENEWLAVNGMFTHTWQQCLKLIRVTTVVDFYNQINLLYGSITEFCSPQSCPEMKATDEFEYLWQDNEQFKKPTKMPAPEYVEHLMSWVQANVDNENMFPSRIGTCSLHPF